MPITNLVWLTSSDPERFTPSNKSAMQSAFDAQASWVATNVPSAPKDRTERGVALFQQIEDPRVVMETAHWTSGAEHGQWLASPEYAASSAPLVSHFDFSKLEYFHLDVSVFGDEEAQKILKNSVPGGSSAVIELARLVVASDKKAEFIAAWETGKSVMEKHSGSAARGGFRVQKVDEETEEFVLFMGWPSVEKHVAFTKDPEYEKFVLPLGQVAKSVNIKHYEKIL
ncbi:hypothetical protein F5Y16DRAFT_144016 [Xylariaceae sp. FL0255]|nr:hypothetical protein F5Y16DRAFT_144016 [Xylariaceae sp. FL0255]